jgi:hypothetical protein
VDLRQLREVVGVTSEFDHEKCRQHVCHGCFRYFWTFENYDVDGFAAYLSDYPNASAWNTTQKRSLDADDDAEESTIKYHDAANLADTGGSRETTMLGFGYFWNDYYTRGVVSESGYVAVFDGADKPGVYAAFINSEILPFASLPEEFQGALGDARDSDDQEVTADAE